MSITSNAAPSCRVNIWRIMGWGGAVALILTPLVAMHFTNEVNWDETDFIVAAIIFGVVGSLVEFAIRFSSDWYFRFGTMFAVLAGFMVIWSNLAVGMIGNEDNPVNLWFGAVLLIAIIGSIAARYRTYIMANAMFVAGVLQVAIGTFAGVLGTDIRGGIFTVIIAAPWIVSGALLRRAAVTRPK
jgi:hypothetical protein